MHALEHNLVGHPSRIRTTSPALSSPGVAFNRAVVLLMTRNGLPVVDEEKVRLRFMPFHLAVTESSCSLREVRFAAEEVALESQNRLDRVEYLVLAEPSELPCPRAGLRRFSRGLL